MKNISSYPIMMSYESASRHVIDSWLNTILIITLIVFCTYVLILEVIQISFFVHYGYLILT